MTAESYRPSIPSQTETFTTLAPITTEPVARRTVVKPVKGMCVWVGFAMKAAESCSCQIFVPKGISPLTVIGCPFANTDTISPFTSTSKLQTQTLWAALFSHNVQH